MNQNQQYSLLQNSEPTQTNKKDISAEKKDLQKWMKWAAWMILFAATPLVAMSWFADIVDRTNIYLGVNGAGLYFLPNVMLFIGLIFFLISFMVEIKGIAELPSLAFYPLLILITTTMIFNGLYFWKSLVILDQCASVDYTSTTIQPNWGLWANHTALCTKGGLFTWVWIYFIFTWAGLLLTFGIAIAVWYVSRSVPVWQRLVLAFKYVKAKLQNKAEKLGIIKNTGVKYGIGHDYIENYHRHVSNRRNHV